MNQANNTVSSSSQPQLCFVNSPGASKTDPANHRMAYWSWGDPANPRTLICVHGLSRQGRDFDVLAGRLADTWHVVCPDVVGRGQSDWLAEPKGYQVFTYASDMVSLVQHLKTTKNVLEPLEIDWVGTSMGGLIGLGFSSLPPEVSGAKLRRMVLNDVGPRLKFEALVRIGEYLGRPMHFATEQEGADYLWSISTSFGPHTPEQWLALSRPMLRPAPSGQGCILHYDPAIAEPFKSVSADAATAGQAMVWQTYEQLKCQVLITRGMDSDLLDADTAREMTQRGPKATLVEFPGVGHAPTLLAEDQVTAVEAFLRA
jgi:pimeloyl-ACP methyl ester carboxylesterase